MNNLRKLRKRFEIPARHIALYLDVSLDTLYRYERGTQMPRADQLKKLSYLYRVSVDELLGIRKEPA